MAKDKKSKAAEKKARVAAKQNKKATQKEKKIKSKGTGDSDAEDVDLESVLAEYAEKVRSHQPILTLLTVAARAFSESYGIALRATVSTFVSNDYWFSVKCERTTSIWWRILQRLSCCLL